MVVANRKQRIRFGTIGRAVGPDRRSHRFVKARQLDSPATGNGGVAYQVQADSSREVSP